MARLDHLTMACVVCVSAGASVCYAPSAASQPGVGQQLADEIARLSSAVLANPLNATAAAKLLELRQQQQQLRHEALDGLVVGLQSFLDDKRVAVRPGLTKAMQSPHVSGLADAALAPASLSLDELLQQSRRALGPEVCSVCGDTREDDCPRCSDALGEQRAAESLLRRLPAGLLPLEPTPDSEARLAALARWATPPGRSGSGRLPASAVGAFAAAALVALLLMIGDWSPAREETPTYGSYAAALPDPSFAPTGWR